MAELLKEALDKALIVIEYLDHILSALVNIFTAAMSETTTAVKNSADTTKKIIKGK
jgi:hypothetical protein